VEERVLYDRFNFRFDEQVVFIGKYLLALLLFVLPFLYRLAHFPQLSAYHLPKFFNLKNGVFRPDFP
jgi:hypothetical protein